MANTTEAIRATAGKLGFEDGLQENRDSANWSLLHNTPTVPLGDEGNIKVVQHFKYLGAYCSADGTNTKELNHRVGKVAGAFRELDRIFKYIKSLEYQSLYQNAYFKACVYQKN